MTDHVGLIGRLLISGGDHGGDITGTTDPVWTVCKPEAKRILDALAAKGLVIVPREPTEAMVAAERKGMERALAAACSASKPAMGARYNGGVQQAVNAIRADMEAGK